MVCFTQAPVVPSYTWPSGHWLTLWSRCSQLQPAAAEMAGRRPRTNAVAITLTFILNLLFVRNIKVARITARSNHGLQRCRLAAGGAGKPCTGNDLYDDVLLSEIGVGGGMGN